MAGNKTYRDGLSLLEFIAEKVEDMETRRNTNQLAREYKQEKNLTGTIVGYKNQLETLRDRIYLMNEFDTNTKVKMMFVLSASVTRAFLLKLRERATVEVDTKHRITKYQSFDGSLELSVRRSMRQSGRYAALTDPDHMMLQLLGEMSLDAAEPLVDDDFIEEFCARTNDRDSRRRLLQRYELVKQSIEESNAYDYKMKARMAFASNATVRGPFLNDLRREATVLVDEHGKIVEYKSNDGEVTLRNTELLRLYNQRNHVPRAIPPHRLPPPALQRQPPQQPAPQPVQQQPAQPPVQQKPAQPPVQQKPAQPPVQQKPAPQQSAPLQPVQQPAQRPPVTLKQEPEPEIEIPPDEDDPAAAAPAPDVPLNEQALYLIQEDEAAAAAAAANVPGPAPPAEQNNNNAEAAVNNRLALIKHEPQVPGTSEVTREFIANYQTIIAISSPGCAQAREVLKWLNYFISTLQSPNGAHVMVDLKENVEAAIRACGTAARPIAIDGVLTTLGALLLVIVKKSTDQKPIPEGNVQISRFLMHLHRAFQYFQHSQAAFNFRLTVDRVNQDFGQHSFPTQCIRSVLETVLTLAS